MITKLICKIFKLVHIDSYEQMRRTLNNEIHALKEQYNSEVLNYEQNLSILRRKIEQLKEENKFLKEELSIANKRIEELLMERDGYLLQIKSLEELISKQRKESLLQKVNYENIVKENDSLKESVKSYEALVEQLEGNLNKNNNAYKEDIEKIKKACDHAIGLLNLEIKKLTEQFNCEKNFFQKKLIEASDEKYELETLLTQERNISQVQTSSCENLTKENDNLKESLKLYMDIAEQLECSLREKEDIYKTDIESIKEDYNHSIEQLNSDVNKLKNQFNEENELLKKKLITADARIEKLVLDRDNYIRQIKEFKSLLSQERDIVLLQKSTCDKLAQDNDSLKESVKSYKLLVEQYDDKLKEKEDAYRDSIKSLKGEYNYAIGQLNSELEKYKKQVEDLKKARLEYEDLFARQQEDVAISKYDFIAERKWLQKELEEYLRENENLKNLSRISEFVKERKIIDLQYQIKLLRIKLNKLEESKYNKNNNTNVFHIEYSSNPKEQRIIRLKESNKLIVTDGKIYFNFIMESTKLDKAYDSITYIQKNIYIAQYGSKKGILYCCGNIAICLKDSIYNDIKFNNGKIELISDDMQTEILTLSQLMKSTIG